MIAATEKKSAKRYLFHRKYFFFLPPPVVADFLSRLVENLSTPCQHARGGCLHVYGRAVSTYWFEQEKVGRNFSVLNRQIFLRSGCHGRKIKFGGQNLTTRQNLHRKISFNCLLTK